MDTDTSASSSSVDKKHPAQLLFALFVFVCAGLLLTQITKQTTFLSGKRFIEQPGFWSAVSLAGMTLCAGLHALFLWRQRFSDYPLSSEVLHWFKAVEFVLWFLAYVWLVPVTGYLPATLIFCPLLTLRLGYQNKQAIVWAVLAGVFVVVLFKTFLQVKIPGGMFYEYFPAVVRNFLIVNF